MIRNKKFWKKEKEAPILNRNGNHINEENADSFCKRVENFYDIMHCYIKENVDIDTEETCDNEEILRIIELDAIRTFNDEENRKLLIEVLQKIYPFLKDYHQGVSFIASFLLLFLEPNEVVKIIIGLHQYYLNGYFKSMPKAYVRDARVFLNILKYFHNELYEHINKLISPEAFVSKWFIGLNVHVLTFESLILFFEHLLKEGPFFLFKYGVSLCRTLEKDIMKTNDVSKILALLRLEQKVFPNDYKETKDQEEGEFFTNIIYNALSINLDDINIDKLREEVNEQMAKEEEKRKQYELENSLSDDEIVFSDENDYDDEHDETDNYIYNDETDDDEDDDDDDEDDEGDEDDGDDKEEEQEKKEN